MLSCESGSRFAVGSRLRETVFEIGTLSMDRLRPAIVDITPEGLTLDCTATGLQLDLQESEEKFRGLLAIHLEVVQADGPIIVTGTVEGTALRQCVRCLAEYADPLFVSVYAEFLKKQPLAVAKPAAQGQGRRGSRRGPQPAQPVEESEDEDELYRYQGEHLDLVPMLREQIILAAPMQPLCQENCLGLCPRCGQNLNERRCGCPPEQGPSPFRVVRERRKDSGTA